MTTPQAQGTSIVLQSRSEQAEALLEAHIGSVGAAIAICGLLWRLHYASDFYLNPDEAFHYWVATYNWHGWIELVSRSAHPPLFFLILREMSYLGRSEWVLRLAPMTAGALFPWFVMLWVQSFTSKAAALVAQLFLTFSPTMVDLSTEVRGYSVAFVFLSVSLVLLERALDRDSKTYMAWFHICLYLAILTEYCVAGFVAAMGVYALLRLWRSHKQGHLWVVWATGQVGALGLYTVLIVTQMSKHWPGDGTVDGWLKTEFLQPGQNVMSFVLRGSLNQFRYGIGVRSLGVFAGAAFLFGLCRLWKNGKPLHAMLLVLPICLGCLGAVLHLFPYGASRHTAVVGIAVAAGIGSAAAALTRNRILPIFLASFLMLPVWNWFGEDHYFPVSHERRSLSQMRQATQFLISAVPVGSVVVTDGGTYYMLAYYLNSNEVTLAGHVDGAHEVAGLHFAVARTFRFVGDAALRQFLSQTRHSYNLEGPVWVATGGYDIEVTNPASNAKPFEKTIAIFENSDPPVAMSGLTPGI